MFTQRIKLIGYKITALFIQKMTYSRPLQILMVSSSLIFLLLYIMNQRFVFILFFILLLSPCIGAFLMKPYDNIIVISKITGSPHALIKNREVISSCFDGDRLNSIQLLKIIKRSMYKFINEYSRSTKRRYITTRTHKLMFRNLGLDKFDFVVDVKEIKPAIVRDKLIFISFRELLKRKELDDLLRKIPYYKLKIDMKQVREYFDKNPEKIVR